MHDTQVVEHLHKGDEENDGTELSESVSRPSWNTAKVSYSVHEEPMLVYGLLIEKESGSVNTPVQEICGKSGDPLEDGKSSPSFQNEHGDDLLQEESYDDGGP